MHPLSAVRHNGQTAYIWGAERVGEKKNRPYLTFLWKGAVEDVFEQAKTPAGKKVRKRKKKKTWFRKRNDKDFCFSKLNWTDSEGGVISKHQIPKISAVICKSDLLHVKLREPNESTGTLQRNFLGKSPSAVSISVSRPEIPEEPTILLACTGI